MRKQPALGAGMGYGTYSCTPIRYFLAQTWFWGSAVELAVAGELMGLLARD